MKHLSQLEESSASPVEIVHEFLVSEADNYKTWHKLHRLLDPVQYTRHNMGSMSFAITYGYTQLLEKELEWNLPRLQEAGNYEYYLGLAASQGHTSIVQLLLDIGLPEGRSMVRGIAL